jgi:rifampicin phosphotransferase
MIDNANWDQQMSGGWFMKTRYVRKLNHIRKEDLKAVGGKGANLGEMMAAQLPVPDGFVILTDAYRLFVDSNGLDQKIKTALQESEESHESLEKAVCQIQSWFENAEIPPHLMAEIDGLYQALNQPAVAVRSSATAEDLPGLSFAGQYATFLNIQGLDALHLSIKQCWASLWNSRVIAYRKKHEIGLQDLAHGVVVQELIASEKSGILFTANPVNGRRDQLLLNASWGLGDAVVGGDVTPDQWIVDKSSGAIVESAVATKNVMTTRIERGVKLEQVPPQYREIASLTDQEVDTLMKLAMKVEDIYGAPQDIEWAFAQGIFYLVQTRPVTTLYPVPESVPGKEGLRVYMNMNNYTQGMKEPLTPMGEQVIREMLKNVIRRYGSRDPDARETFWWYHNLNGRIFADMTEISRKQWEKLENVESDKDPVTTKALLQLIDRNNDAFSDGTRFSYIKKINFRLLGFLISAGWKYTYGKRSAESARKQAIRHGDQMVRRMREKSRQLVTLEERLSFIESTSGDIFISGFEVIFYVLVSSTYIKKVREMMKKYQLDPTDLKAVEQALPYSVTTEMGLDLLKIAEALDVRGQLASAKSEEIVTFLQRYGHRNNIELDVGIPTWREDPSYVVDVINSYIESQSYREGLRRFEAARIDGESAIHRIIDQFVDAGKMGKVQHVAMMLTDFRNMFGIRELPKFYVRHALTIYRRILMDVGHELSGLDRISSADDVFFLTFSDIRSNKDLKSVIAHNKTVYQQELNRPAPRLITSTGETIYAAAAEDGENTLRGIPVSPGEYEGPVRIVNDLKEIGRLKPGDILVTVSTNPAWTPLFMRLGGLIMETGGQISHGSVVAREYGLPAVAGVYNATAVFKDGQIVRINGDTGSVELMRTNEDRLDDFPL